MHEKNCRSEEDFQKIIDWLGAVRRPNPPFSSEDWQVWLCTNWLWKRTRLSRIDLNLKFPGKALWRASQCWRLSCSRCSNQNRWPFLHLPSKSQRWMMTVRRLNQLNHYRYGLTSHARSFRSLNRIKPYAPIPLDRDFTMSVVPTSSTRSLGTSDSPQSTNSNNDEVIHPNQQCK